MDYKLYHGDCLDVMRDFSDCSIDLTVTSPPTTTCDNTMETLNSGHLRSSNKSHKNYIA